jgi:transcriptional regulator with XRE-family HTH domain
MGKRPPPEPPKGNSPVPDDLRKIFGQNVRAARIKAGLTQTQLAERTGLRQQYVSLVEAGHQNITLDTMAALSRAVGRDVSALLRMAARSVSSMATTQERGPEWTSGTRARETARY